MAAPTAACLSASVLSRLPDGSPYSHAGDRFDVCRDFVTAKLGMPLDAWQTKRSGAPGPVPTYTPGEPDPEPDRGARIARALKIWNETTDARGTIIETYLAGRGLDLVSNINEVARFHPRCPWRDEAEGRTIYVPAMVALMRSITTDEPQAIHRTRLTPEGAKVGRRMLGIASGAAVKLDDDDAVTMGLAIGEGVETVLAARQIGFRPAWALGSAGAIAAFPVLGGVEALTILAENDATNARAVETCARRWHEAGCEVTIIEPTSGSDILDAMRGAS